MTEELEEEYLDEESHLVPKLDPDDKCNGKKSERVESENDGYRSLFRGYCQNKAGKGTEHVGEGRCKHHGGATSGAPAHNQNAKKTGLTSDPHHYHQNLPVEEKEWIEDTTEAILDRIRTFHGREPDMIDRNIARGIAINFHILSEARDYSKDNLVQTIVHENSTSEEKGALIEEVRRFQNSTIQNLRDLGVLEDPESQKANALDSWRNFVENGDDDSDDGDEVIVVDSEQE